MATSCPLGFVPAYRQHCQKQESVKIQQEGLALVNHRHEGGIASGLDLAQQQTLLDSTVTQLYLLQQQRAQFEHAIAVLTGNAASTFSVGVAPLLTVPPPIPLGIPSDLLERRPDVATAERAMAQQNALVGVAKTAFYPQFTTSGSAGFQSITLGSLISAPSTAAGMHQPFRASKCIARRAKRFSRKAVRTNNLSSESLSRLQSLRWRPGESI